jgi:hypothetical protein
MPWSALLMSGATRVMRASTIQPVLPRICYSNVAHMNRVLRRICYSNVAPHLYNIRVTFAQHLYNIRTTSAWHSRVITAFDTRFMMRLLRMRPATFSPNGKDSKVTQMHFLHSLSTEAHVRKAQGWAFSELQPDWPCSSTVVYYGYLKDDLSSWKQAKFDPGRNTHD